MSFEQIIRQYGDDLYRLAILLTPDPAAAHTLMRRVAHSFCECDPASVLNVAQALHELAHTRHNSLRRNRLPGWVGAPGVTAEDAPLLATIARLPHAQRLALGMAALHSFDAEERSSYTIAGQEWRTLVRDALLSLLPVVDPAIDRSMFDPDQAPEECRPVRAALTLDPTVVHASSTMRGHLALCEMCRQAARDWRSVVMQVEETLRGALRPIRLPEDVAAQTIAAARPDPRPIRRRLIESRWLRRAFLPLAVMFLIALIIWPRGQVEEESPPTASILSLHELIERAEQTLYAPSPGEGGWQGGYLIRWTFADQTYAYLRGDLWIDRETGQHRIQLVHQQGGAPYEFQLVDSRSQAWYAVAPAYSATLGLPLEGEESWGIRASADADMRQRLLQARLNSGAWVTPRLYLAQARMAELQRWGRRQLDDGTQVEVIGFRGVSLPGFPPDAPNTVDSSATILLVIDGVTGSLREIRELIGPSEGEQVSRTVWAFDGGREVDPRDEARIFGIAFAWNGRGTFTARNEIVSPYLPLLPLEAIIPLKQAMREIIVLPDPPPDTIEAILARDLPMIKDEIWSSTTRYIAIYIGAGRRLIIRAAYVADMPAFEAFTSTDVEQLRVGPYGVWLRPGVRWNYRVLIVDGQSPLWKAPGDEGGRYLPLQPLVADVRPPLEAASRSGDEMPQRQMSVGDVQPFPLESMASLDIEAQGYTRAEVLKIVASLGVITPQRYEEQRAFFLADATDSTPR
ncbi:hypothetical protein [Roseiflexus sp.]|uniref:hypothetical protein n=1 Tax=Roseiflexus sp. TaxID=2562120 RepID=UPI0021DBABE2|nr:hypothetical protein [Roseiflexus sp.]GIW02485.1 MAG: hypothetical protein KatS3mg058_3888 [Roseiflexus sp.]